MAARNQQLMPTTEGGLDFKFNMTNLLDGYPGHEHALPIYPLYNDVFKTIAQAKMIVTPTLLVSYGGPWAENYFWTREVPYHDPKIQNFFAYEELASKTRRVGGSMSYTNAGWTMDEEQVFPKHAKNMKHLVEAAEWLESAAMANSRDLVILGVVRNAKRRHEYDGCVKMCNNSWCNRFGIG